jgi:CheY-like chemotaxis protein
VTATVVIVEDESELGALLRDVLESFGYRAVLTTGGRAADRIQEIAPAAIVTNYVMPGRNGAEVVREIRDRMPGSAPPIILVTGMANARELAEEVGAQAYLRKPFDMDEFVSVVGRVTGTVR